MLVCAEVVGLAAPFALRRIVYACLFFALVCLARRGARSDVHFAQRQAVSTRSGDPHLCESLNTPILRGNY